jgi:cobalt-zinc-cadmium efflux system protein
MWQKKKEAMARDNKKAGRKLCIVIMITLIFTGVEIAGGIMADSIAILSDAAHLCSDVLGLGVSVWALHVA